MPFQIVNDTIISAGGSYDDLTPREETVRNATLVLTLAIPLLGAFFIWLFSPRGWSYASSWTFSRLAIMWFLTVTIFGTMVFYQRGHTNRMTMNIAILHICVEVLINSLMLHVPFRVACMLAAGMALVLFSASTGSPTIGHVYYWVATLGGAGDFLPVFLLAYGKKWWYAFGALGHVVSAINVFTDAAIFLDVVTFNVLTFIGLWMHVVGITVAIMRESPWVGPAKNIELPSDEIQETPRVATKDTPLPANPLWDVYIPPKTLAVMGVLSLIGAFTTSRLINHFA